MAYLPGMESLLVALADRMAPGPLDPSVSLVSLVASLILTAVVAWWADHVTRERVRHRIAALAEAVPAAGVH
jgi:hypothetical protein